jgi:AbrB family looped-hinge helix DNA binding protein
MLYPTTITSKWQMTIPKQVRKILGLKRQGKVVIGVEPIKKSFTIHQPPSILELAGTFYPKKNRGVSVLKAREYMERHYERT